MCELVNLIEQLREHERNLHAEGNRSRDDEMLEANANRTMELITTKLKDALALIDELADHSMEVGLYQEGSAEQASAWEDRDKTIAKIKAILDPSVP